MWFSEQQIAIWTSRSKKFNELMTTLRHFVWLVSCLGIPSVAALIYFSVYSSEDISPKTSTVERVINEDIFSITKTETLADDAASDQAPISMSLVDGQSAMFCDGDLELTLHMPDNTPQNRIPEHPDSVIFFVLGTNPLERKTLQVGSPRNIGNCRVVVTEIVRQRSSIRDFDVTIMEVSDQ